MLPETQSKGRVPVDNDLLNRLQRGTQIKSAAVFNRKGVMLSGPQPLLILSRLSSVWTRAGPADYAHNFTYYAMLHCSKIYLLCLNLCSILTHYAQIMPNYLCLSSHALLIISNLWINNTWLQHKLTCQSAYHRKDRYTLI